MDVTREFQFHDFLEAHDIFLEIGVENPLLETLRFFDLLSGKALSRMDLRSVRQEKIDLFDLAQKRKEGVPLEYIVGLAPFMGQMFSCSPDTFIPKEQTELLVKVALDFIEKAQESENTLTIIDTGTGCGNIAVSLALNSEKTKILACDISPAAIKIAQNNVNRFNLQDRISLFCGDLFSPFSGLGYEEGIDLVVCNPPYIPTGSLTKLPPEIADHEPKAALDGGAFGIDFYRRLITGTLSMLRPKGILLFEIGVGQEKLITRLLDGKQGYEDVRQFGDGEEIRVMSAVKK